MTAWDYLVMLTRLPHRGSTTPQERQCADLLARELASLDWTVERQPLRAPRDTLYHGPAAILLGYLLAILVARWWPGGGLAMMVLLLIPFVGELLGKRPNFDLLLPQHPSENVVARRPREKPAAPANIIVTAHYDTQRGGYLFHPGFRRFLMPFFTATYLGLVIVPVALILGMLWPGAVFPGWLLASGTGLLLISCLFLLASRLRGRYVQGANDNGSGVALALALARELRTESLAGVSLTFVFTGAEEVGLRGMQQFFVRERHNLDSAATYFVNLDNLGAGGLRYLQGEGMLRYYPYSPRLVDLAASLGSRPAGPQVLSLPNLLLPTDALVPTQAGYHAITFIATDADGVIPNYHWHTDTLENVDQELLAGAHGFLRDYLLALAEQAGEACNIRATPTPGGPTG